MPRSEVMELRKCASNTLEPTMCPRWLVLPTVPLVVCLALCSAWSLHWAVGLLGLLSSGTDLGISEEYRPIFKIQFLILIWVMFLPGEMWTMHSGQCPALVVTGQGGVLFLITLQIPFLHLPLGNLGNCTQTSCPSSGGCGCFLPFPTTVLILMAAWWQFPYLLLPPCKSASVARRNLPACCLLVTYLTVWAHRHMAHLSFSWALPLRCEVSSSCDFPALGSAASLELRFLLVG